MPHHLSEAPDLGPHFQYLNLGNISDTKCGSHLVQPHVTTASYEHNPHLSAKTEEFKFDILSY